MWLADCLQHLGRTFVFAQDIVGWHYDHPRPKQTLENRRKAQSLAEWKRSQAELGKHPWTARSGAWA
jgi:hypothetical protein